jgi:hypothetical protein
MNVVLDLDGTIVFQEPAELEIPGRTSSTYLSRASATLLEKIGDKSNLYIATARNAASVAGMVRLLAQVRFAGFVVECGLVTTTNIHKSQGLAKNSLWLRNLLRIHFPHWQHVDGYERMICCIATGAHDPCGQIGQLLASQEVASQWLLHQERHKTFVYPEPLCKVDGLKKLGVVEIDIAAGDDLRYDFSMLQVAKFPLTTVDADRSLVDHTRSKNGFVATGTSHEAAKQLLEQIDAMI